MGIEAIALVAAAATGGAAVAATVVMTAVAWVGTYMTIAGAITGNKTLMKIGGVLGIAGGVGGMVAGASAGAAGAAVNAGTSTGIDATVNAAVSEAGTAAIGEAAVNGAATTGLEGAGAAAASEGAAASALAGQEAVASTVLQPEVSTSILGDAAGATDAASLAAQEAVGTGNAITDVNMMKTGNVTGGLEKNPFSQGMDIAGNDLSGGTVSGSIKPANGGTSSKSFFDSILDGSKESNNLLNGAMTLGSGALSGIQKGKQAAEEKAHRDKMMANGNAIPGMKYNGIFGKAAQ